MWGVIASLVSALALASPAQAVGLTFNWSFNANTNGGSGATLGTVSGTISGLQDNKIYSAGGLDPVTATVLVTPDAQYQGVVFNSVSVGNITVAGGVVTSAGLIFNRSNIDGPNFFSLLELFLGNASSYSIPLLAGPPNAGAYIGAYYLGHGTTGTTVTDGTTFSSAIPVPFDFDPSFGLVALGGIWASRKVIKKIKTSKKSV
ncbi:MAG: hypothetical protein WCP16_05110 [Pseudanabaena sp. ELA645]|jgi:hypothetical protein